MPLFQQTPKPDPIPRDLATAAPSSLWQVPVAIVLYAPTVDGNLINSRITGYEGTFTSLRNHVLRLARLHKWMMEEGTRFHGYRDPSAKPSLGYRCVYNVTFQEDIPARTPGKEGPPDYAAILERIGGRELVNRQGVKEFWIYHWHHGNIVPIETNLSSPTSPDISNSDRTNDLPVYDKTYLVLGANFNRGPDKTVHNIGHQMEAVLREMATRQDGDSRLFDLFTGEETGRFRPGRCGNCHFPPNATKDYDYDNRTPIMSDIEDWNPRGTGKKTPVACTTWEKLPYRSPTGDAPGRADTVFEPDAWWYLYWFQNFPGWNNKIAHPMGQMTNWWRYLGDWDGAMRERYGLWTPKSTPLQPGESALYGTVLERRGGSWFMRVSNTLSSAGRYDVVAPRVQEVVVTTATNAANAANAVPNESAARSQRVRIIGKSAGVGKPVQARLITPFP